MRLEHYSSEQLKREIRDIVGRYLDVGAYRVFFFGSRVDGKGNERSDIDIGIEGPREVPRDALSKIKNDIDRLNILYKIDVVDFADTVPQFRTVAKQQVEFVT